MLVHVVLKPHCVAMQLQKLYELANLTLAQYEAFKVGHGAFLFLWLYKQHINHHPGLDAMLFY